MRRVVAQFLLAAALTPAGCAHLLPLVYRPARIAECDPVIPPSTSIRGDFRRRMRVHVDAQEVSEGFEVVLQKRGDRITVVGLTRFGATAFTIVQEDDELEIRSNMRPIETVPPRNLLGDLYIWPLGIVANPAVRVEPSADGKSATIVHQRCGYRTTIVDTSDEHD